MGATPEKKLAVVKENLRRIMVAQRELLTDEACGLTAASLRRRLPVLLAELGFGPDRPPRLATYSAIRREADLALACEALLAWPATLYYPAIEGKGSEARLTLAALPPGMAPTAFLVPGRFGIDEPPASAWLTEPPELDIVLLPGLAFDLAGNRLGWGRAFYDNLIPTLPGQPVLIGICHDFQILPDGLPVSVTDRPVDWLLTPERMIKTRRS